MKIRSYSKQELAMLYFPDLQPHAALARPRRWIRRCQPLSEQMDRCWMGKNSKFYSKHQVELIVKYLDEP